MKFNQLIVPLLCLSSIGLASRASAHVMQTDYALESTQFSITATYSTGEAVPQTPVVVYAPNDHSKPWMVGTTDEKGKFSFQPDRALQGNWEVKIGTGDHGDILSVPVNQHGVELEKISRADGQTGHVHLNSQVALSKSGVEVTPVAETASHNPADYLAIFGALGLSGGIGSALFFWRKKR
jgi:nickel transport protein